MSFEQYNELNGTHVEPPSPKSRQKLSQPLVSNKNQFIYALNDLAQQQQTPAGNLQAQAGNFNIRPRPIDQYENKVPASIDSGLRSPTNNSKNQSYLD